MSISSIKDQNNKTTNFVGVFYEVSRLLKLQEKLSHKAFHDVLTQLPNRELFFDRLEKQIAHAKRNQKLLAVIFIDIDDFKSINDSLGHDFGDAFLLEVANRLQYCCRDEDTVARFGGDEFIMLLSDLNAEEEITQVAERIFKAFSAQFCYHNEDLEIKASLGAAYYPKDAKEMAELVRRADVAMYRAKQGGKNKFHLSGSVK